MLDPPLDTMTESVGIGGRLRGGTELLKILLFVFCAPFAGMAPCVNSSATTEGVKDEFSCCFVFGASALDVSMLAAVDVGATR